MARKPDIYIIWPFNHVATFDCMAILAMLANQPNCLKDLNLRFIELIMAKITKKTSLKKLQASQDQDNRKSPEEIKELTPKEIDYYAKLEQEFRSR